MGTKENNKESLLARWKNRDKSNVAENTISKAPTDAKLPLSQAQKRLWFLQQLYPDSPFYNYSEAYTFNGNLDLNLLKRAIQNIFDNHDILRTRYHLENNEIFQSVDPDVYLKFTDYDLSTLSENLANCEAQKIIANQAKKKFDLSNDCLVRPCLITLSSNQHILQLTMHHIVTDEWTMKLFREELAKNYKLLLKSDNSLQKKKFLQYTDYAYWENKKDLDYFQLEYWKDQLSGDIPILGLPTDFNRPIQSKFQGAISETQEFSESLSKNLLSLAKKLSTTPFVLMLSVYYVFLNKCSGQNDLLVGSPITLRDSKLTENLFGFFLNTLVFRMQVNKDIPFSEFVKDVRVTTFDAFKNKSFPFGEIVKALKIERSLSTNPFFQVMFVYNEEIKIPDFGEGLEVTHRFLDPKVSKFDFTIFVTEKNGILSSTFEYSSELFKASTIERFQSYFKTILEEIVSKPDESILKLNMIPQEEKLILLRQAPPIHNNFSEINGIHEIIEKICQTTPNAKAVTFKDTSVTYKQLNDRANALGFYLQNHLKGRNKVVGLCVNRSIEMITGMLAILKVGCAYLPIDPKYPEERIAFMLEDANVNMVITEYEFQYLFSSPNIVQINIYNIEDINPTKKYSFTKVKPLDLAYIIYTSGSSGKPKGVPISHKNIINSTNGRLEFYNENPKAFLLMSSISFDSSKAGIFWTLCTGGHLIVGEKRIEQDIVKIGNLIQQHNITHTLMLPSLYSLTLQHIEQTQLNSLKTVIVAGETCSKLLLSNHLKTLPEVNLYNEYGPTEATVWCIAQKLEQENLKDLTIPIGKPVANAKVYILDKSLSPVPYGCIGEIYIGGPVLTMGYINRPALNEEAFIDSPFCANEKIYKTGDLGKYSINKTIEFLGRADQQIKVRGFRVELNEIEKVIKTYNRNIKDAFVIMEDEFENEHIETNFNTETSTSLDDMLEHLDEEDVKHIISSIENLSIKQKKYLLNQLEK